MVSRSLNCQVEIKILDAKYVQADNVDKHEQSVYENNFDEIRACFSLSWSTTPPTPLPLGTSNVESLLSTKLGSAMS